MAERGFHFRLATMSLNDLHRAPLGAIRNQKAKSEKALDQPPILLPVAPETDTYRSLPVASNFIAQLTIGGDRSFPASVLPPPRSLADAVAGLPVHATTNSRCFPATVRWPAETLKPQAPHRYCQSDILAVGQGYEFPAGWAKHGSRDTGASDPDPTGRFVP